MFWAGIVRSEFIGPFNIDDGVKLNSENYTKFLENNFFPWYRSQTRKFNRECIFMHDNAPTHASHFTKTFLTAKNIPESKIMTLPPSFIQTLIALKIFGALLKVKFMKEIVSTLQKSLFGWPFKKFVKKLRGLLLKI